jgi:hypothetical protein
MCRYTFVFQVQSGAALTTTQVINAIASSSSTPLGPIVGGILGALAACFIVAVVLYYFALRRVRSGSREPVAVIGIAREMQVPDDSRYEVGPIPDVSVAGESRAVSAAGADYGPVTT